jgi:hypothetical protein
MMAPSTTSLYDRFDDGGEDDADDEEVALRVGHKIDWSRDGKKPVFSSNQAIAKAAACSGMPNLIV